MVLSAIFQSKIQKRNKTSLKYWNNFKKFIDKNKYKPVIKHSWFLFTTSSPDFGRQTDPTLSGVPKVVKLKATFFFNFTKAISLSRSLPLYFG